MIAAVMAGALAAPAARTPPAPAQPAAQQPPRSRRARNRPPPPTRDPNTPGYVEGDALARRAGPRGRRVRQLHHRADAQAGARDDGCRPACRRAPFTTSRWNSTDSKIYPGIRREQGTFGTPDPKNPAKLDVTTSAPAPYTRRMAVYIPQAVRSRHACAVHRRR